MAMTTVGVNSPRAVKRFSGDLAVETSKQSYFGRRFTASGANAKVPIQLLTELESDAGELISFDLLAELRMAPIEGDNTLEGNEEAQRLYTDQLYIDQARCGVNTGGRMTRKRTLHNLRQRARDQQASWWARFQDELIFTYLAGTRGINENFLLPLGYNGRASNPLQAPTAKHHFFSQARGSSAPSNANGITNQDPMDLGTIDLVKATADVQGGGASDVPIMQPVIVDGEEHFVMVMHTWQEDQLRTSTASHNWLDIQKSAAAALGRSSPIFRGAMGMYRDVVLHSHRNVIRFDAGSAGAVPAARALFLGAQAGVMAFGSPGTGMRYGWHEETADRGNQVIISTSSIFGVKKTQFLWEDTNTSHDQGVMAVDTYCADPNA